MALSHAIQGGHPFTGSSTTHAGRTDGAWHVGMYYGFVASINKTATNNVWPVHAGQ